MKQKNVILMVVAVGCGLVAAFLTAQMSAKQPEQMEVVVASKDIPVGTLMTRDELKGLVKIAKRPKEGLPPTAVLNPEELVDKRLSRPVRAEEVLNSQDLSKGGVITLPDGYDMVSLQLGAGQAAAGFVGPGSRVDVLATLRLGNKLDAFPLLVNMLVVAVNTETAYSQQGTFPNLSMVSFAVKPKEALLLSLAKSRGCSIELLLRHPGKSTEIDKTYNIDKVIELLSDEKNPGGVKNVPEGNRTEAPKAEAPKAETPKAEVPPPPSVPMVKVLVAKSDIKPNTEITADLIRDEFEEKVLPKEYAGGALGDLNEALGQYLRTGVAKGQWVTPGMVGIQSPKSAPPVIDQKPAPDVPAAPAQPSAEPKAPAVKRKTIDVTLHTTTGTVVHRYEEVAPGKWKKVAELTPERANQAEAAEPAPEAPKGERKAD